jgi:hypothetical protein
MPIPTSTTTTAIPIMTGRDLIHLPNRHSSCACRSATQPAINLVDGVLSLIVHADG